MTKRILRLVAENIKRIKAIDLSPKGNTVIVGGENDQGKTSFLDCIPYIFAGRRAQCERPIRDGAEEAFILCELDDIVVTRNIKASGGDYLKVKNRDGAEQKSPQAILDKLYGEIAFDPLEFSRMDSARQVETLKALVGLDFSEQDKALEDLTAKRKGANKAARDLEGANREMPEYPEAPAKPIAVADLLDDLGMAQAVNIEIQSKEREIAAQEEELDDIKADITLAEEAVKRAKAKLAEEVARHGAAQGRLADMVQELGDAKEVPVDPIKAKIKDAETINEHVRANAAAADAREELARIKGRAATYTEEMKEIIQTKATALRAVKFPVEGLSFDEEGVTYKGLPFRGDQIGSAVLLRVSVAIGIAMNPELKVLLIRDGSLLDDSSLDMIAGMAEAAEAQVWIERVGKGPECQVIIEDGVLQYPPPIDKPS